MWGMGRGMNAVVDREPPTGFASTPPSHSRHVPRTLNLTFDDGPDRTWTPLLLEQLRRCRVSATFFMVGERVLAYPDLPRQVLAAGHHIQLHCHRHIRHTELTEPELLHDSESALAAFADLGIHPRLWRAPWGVQTEASHRVAERLGLRLVRWSIDTHDWRGDDPAAMLARVRPRLHHGGSVLMHDALGPGATRAGCHTTIALVPALVAAARVRALVLAPMSRPGAWAVDSRDAFAASEFGARAVDGLVSGAGR